MDSEPTSASAADQELQGNGPRAAASNFVVSSQPVISQASQTTPDESSSSDLPRFYGSQGLCLMPRDPRSLFAYWDIDWPLTFRDQRPADRKVYLRVLNSDGAEQLFVEVEPMAGSCYVSVAEADASYSADIGYFHPPTVWNSVATSELATTPPESLNEPARADFATVPFHLSFQRMIDLFRVSKHENESLITKLAELRKRAAKPAEGETFTNEESELIRAMDDAVAEMGGAPSEETNPPDLPVQKKLERLLGFGASSPSWGFGGSSRGL
jgi:hypothetical protein